MRIRLKTQPLWEYALAPLADILESGANTLNQGGVPSQSAPEGTHLQTRDLEISHANPSPL